MTSTQTSLQDVTASQEKSGQSVQEKSIEREALDLIIRAAIQAPSGDNVQPWTFQVTGNTISLYVNRQADDSFFNVNQIASLISSGAALQNMQYMAEALGLQVSVELFPDGEGKDLVGRLTCLLGGTPTGEEKDHPLWKRTTNRRMFATTPVNEALWEKLGKEVDREEGIKLYHNPGDGWRKPIAKAVFMADRVRAERRDLHEYLMQIIRFKSVPKQVKRGGEVPPQLRTGMPLRNLQAGFMGELYMRSIKPWPVMRCANALGVGRAMPVYGWLSVMKSGGIGLVCVDSLSETAVVKAGAAVERVWCELERHGEAFQPLAAVPLLSLRLHLGEEQLFKKNHIPLLKRALSIVQEQMGIPQNMIPLFMFRAGKSAPVTQRTYRRKVEELMR